ncbi:hypothetical protein [Spongiactinospora sp. TRM90649]|uniref:hypothetical protein n=1 Tax=Spongiactinospora sp. TRM90649 TaxID=3031114 RepID=UPI0023F8F2D2|nr:hypothetical protein [Spongiactinospora sp. TRM90649]MDF5756597.1 hypothetical protein [Spongiactinospora sp. TRM90649]
MYGKTAVLAAGDATRGSVPPCGPGRERDAASLQAGWHVWADTREWLTLDAVIKHPSGAVRYASGSRVFIAGGRDQIWCRTDAEHRQAAWFGGDA